MSMPQTPGLTAMAGQLRGGGTNRDAGTALGGRPADAAWRRGISPNGKGYHAVRWTVNHHNGARQGLLAQQVGVGRAGGKRGDPAWGLTRRPRPSGQPRIFPPVTGAPWRDWPQVVPRTRLNVRSQRSVSVVRAARTV